MSIWYLGKLFLGHEQVNLLEGVAVLLQAKVEVAHPKDIVVVEYQLRLLVVAVFRIRTFISTRIRILVTTFLYLDPGMGETHK